MTGIFRKNVSRRELALGTGAALVGNAIPSIGAVQRSINTDLVELMKVTQFSGVDPTGATPSDTGILAAVAAAKIAKVKLIVPAGTYKFTGAIGLLIDVGLMALEGQGVVYFDFTAATCTTAIQVYS
jgi:hypothetical protein